ncbi:hypothetical protein P3X46_020944 [Hevea brasiliensis]|uniref:Cytochrome P450 n=1 Tax=Hevea brasiliensis TaxID=3981 RepID=A0ABQ9LF52_HEVBR|nr:cytochrome P450 CYP82D47-like [Hevea brasiliensis]KAJ9166158.1 hypothetical protein P3X46_020944 [Hevea brasiliensis]
MDYISPYFNTTIAAAGVFVLLILPYYLLRKWKSRASKGILAPQPRGAWPLTGHLSLLSGSHPPHVTLGALADKYGPVFTIRVGVHPVLVVSSSDVAKELFTGANDVIVTFRPALVAAELMGYNYGLFPFTPGGPYWSETRKISTFELLSNSRLELLKHIRIQEVETSIKELHKAWEDKKVVDMKQWFSDLNLNVLLRMIIGKKYFGGGAVGDEKEGRRFQEGMTILFHYLGTLVLRDAVPFLGWMDVGGHEKVMKKTAKELDDALEKWLQEHKRNRYLGEKSKGDQDFMDVMLSFLDGKSLEGYDADTINKATSLSMIAGNETVTVAMTWALALLLNNRPVLKKAQEELDKIVGRERLVNDKDISNLFYLQAIVKETLRLYPPAFIPGPRQFTQDCTIGGYYVPKNTWLMVNVWKIQRDPSVWPDPTEFKPERFLTTHKNVDVRSQNFELLPFGGGRRACPAASYVLHIVHLTLATLLQAFEISTPTDAAIDMTPGAGLANMKTTPLEAVVSPRLPPCCYE